MHNTHIGGSTTAVRDCPAGFTGYALGEPWSQTRLAQALRKILLGSLLTCLGAASPTLSDRLIGGAERDPPNTVLVPPVETDLSSPNTQPFKPVEPLLTKMVKTSEKKLRAMGNNVTDLSKAECLDELRQQITGLMGQRVFVKFTVVAVDQNKPRSAVERLATSNTTLDTVVRGAISWRSDICLTDFEKKKIADAKVQAQASARRGSTEDARGWIETADSEVAEAEGRRRPYQEIYVRARSKTVKSWNIGDVHTVRAVVAGGAAFVCLSGGQQNDCDAAYIGLELIIDEDARTLATTPAKAVTKP